MEIKSFLHFYRFYAIIKKYFTNNVIENLIQIIIDDHLMHYLELEKIIILVLK